HHPDDVPWGSLPSRCVVQLHWRRIEPFRTQLQREDFQVVALARHPFDVLISILHFAPNEPDTARWLNGEGGDERPIYGLMPRSPGFLDYAVSPRARALLSVSREWWQDPQAHRLRYEHLVADYRYALGQLVEMLGVPPLRGIDQAVEFISLEWLRT